MIYASHLKKVCNQLCCDRSSADSLALNRNEKAVEKYGPASVLEEKDRYHGGDQIITQSIPSCPLKTVSGWKWLSRCRMRLTAVRMGN